MGIIAENKYSRLHQRDVQFSEMSIYDVKDEETKGHSSGNEIPSPPTPMSTTASDQMLFQII
jgi:hypothetical protein